LNNLIFENRSPATIVFLYLLPLATQVISFYSTPSEMTARVSGLKAQV